eukprot:TRINITY_DN38202_c0_g1_i2.p1 TRINITY_DN38202_c0_g1~~TRINITY_DN38202_c0_g1_i2.p1  ORF type:complete len:1198 (-),score=143.77 TRINITY_DN38202_c0_g1_i2:210-3749(-)
METGSQRVSGGSVPEHWRVWVQTVRTVLCDAVVPLLLIHLKRGQPPQIPIASLAVTLDAADGPMACIGAAAVSRVLAEVCPDSVSLQAAGVSEQHSISIRLKSVPACGQAVDRVGDDVRKPAQCAGVVARGYSMAMPMEASRSRTVADPNDKRWRKAQAGFYVNLVAVERELESRVRRMVSQLESYAAAQSASDPPCLQATSSSGIGEVVAQEELDKHPDALGSGHSDAKTSDPPRPDGDTPPKSQGVLGFLDTLTAHAQYRQQINHVEEFAARPARSVPFNDLVDTSGRPLLSAVVLQALSNHLGIHELFLHQFEALKATIGERRHLCLTTGTSSGKSLAFALPILEEFLKKPDMRALILFPTKALAQDQLSKLRRLFHAVCPALRVCTFDGDTPKAERAGLLRDCHVFLTNPDMLHYTIIAANRGWKRILENLCYVVLDEAHVYRGSFGAHAALLFRRFRRVLRHYNASPVFIACSATMSNPGPFFSRLLGLNDSLDDARVVDDDAAGRGERQFCLWNPPLLDTLDDEAPGNRAEWNARKRARFTEREGDRVAPKLPPGVGYKTRSSSYDEAAWILAEALRNHYRVVCFLQVRSMVEVVLQAACAQLEDSPDLQRRIAAYRGGYAAAERRSLEQRLFSGDLRGVVATNALELGIDIGDLDVTIHVGVPPTVASVWQQAGRAGRRGRPSVAVLVAMDAPLEQHFCRNPIDFFRRTLEARLPDVANPILLRGHLLCAAAELAPLAADDVTCWFGSPAFPVIDECQKEGRLVVQAGPRQSVAASTVLYRHNPGRGGKSAKEEVNLRDIDPIQFSVTVRGTLTPIETLDQKLAYMRLHPGAVYFHQKQAYFVEELDLAKRIAWLKPTDPKRLDFYTECREHSQIVLSGGGLARPCVLTTGPSGSPSVGPSSVVRCGGVSVHWRMYGFRKKAKVDHRLLDQIDLSFPSVEYPSQAVWMDLPGSVLQPVARDGHSVDRGGLHAIEHAMISLAPVCFDVEGSELSCQHTRRDSDPNRFLLLLFETQKGGGGSASKVYEFWERLLTRALVLIEECTCEEGCPNCIVAPRCGEYNHGLDKAAAIKIGQALGLSRNSACSHRNVSQDMTEQTGLRASSENASSCANAVGSAESSLSARGVFARRLCKSTAEESSRQVGCSGAEGGECDVPAATALRGTVTPICFDLD